MGSRGAEDFPTPVSVWPRTRHMLARLLGGLSGSEAVGRKAAAPMLFCFAARKCNDDSNIIPNSNEDLILWHNTLLPIPPPARQLGEG